MNGLEEEEEEEEEEKNDFSARSYLESQGVGGGKLGGLAVVCLVEDGDRV